MPRFTAKELITFTHTNDSLFGKTFDKIHQSCYKEINNENDLLLVVFI